MALGQGYIQAFDNFINRVLIGPVADAIGGAVSKIASISGSEVAGVSTSGGGVMGGFREMLGLSSSHETQHVPEQKLGRSAAIHNALHMATPDKFEVPTACLGELVAPVHPNLRPASQSMSV